MTLTVIGHGYVGLVTAAVFADLGNTVWVIGRTPSKIKALNRGKIPFFEPGLEELVKRNLSAKRLFFTLQYSPAINQSQVIFICVGTPSADNGQADLSSVFEVARKVGKYINGYKVIVTKSTVPPGTNRRVAEIVSQSQKAAGKKEVFDIASCPEFLREGTAISDTLNPDRVVIGTETKKAEKILLELHKSINGKRVLTTLETAEMIKYVANAILSTKISFANAIAFLCEKTGADVEAVLEGVGLDKRIGRNFLHPGVGYGGSCFPKDVKALIAFAEELGYDFKLLKAVDEINHQAREFFVEKVIGLLKGDKSKQKPLMGKTIGVLGLAFKPNTDDMREAPSIYIINRLQEMGAIIKAYDPQAQRNANRLLKNVIFCPDAYQTARDTDAMILITEWNEFRHLDLERMKKLMKGNIFVDGRNIYEPDQMKKLGFIYKGVGR